MPLLPLPTDLLIAGDLPVSSSDDILAILPSFLKNRDVAPVRDAILQALTAIFLEYQLESEASLAMEDVLRAVGSALEGLAEDRGVFKFDSDTDETLRARLLNAPEIVTPQAIIDVVNQLLSPYTTVEAQYCESVQDRWYIGSDADKNTRPWHSFVFDKNTAGNPEYVDRLYTEYAYLNNGFFRSNSNVGGARVFSDSVGRLFMIRLPDLSGVDQLGGFVDSSSIVDRFYVGGVGVASAIRQSGTTVLDLFNTIASTLSRIKGHSIRYVLYMDPKLRLPI